MRGVTAWMLAAGILVVLLAGCKQPQAEEPVAQAPAQEESLPSFPEEQVPPPEPQPQTTTASRPAKAPPVDTTATAAEPSPAATARPLPKDNYAPAEPKPARSYVVKKGDTLQKISKKFYGTSRKWRAIYKANRDVLKKGPDHLQVGTKLEIP